MNKGKTAIMRMQHAINSLATVAGQPFDEAGTLNYQWRRQTRTLLTTQQVYVADILRHLKWRRQIL